MSVTVTVVGDCESVSVSVSVTVTVTGRRSNDGDVSLYRGLWWLVWAQDGSGVCINAMAAHRSREARQ